MPWADTQLSSDDQDVLDFAYWSGWGSDPGDDVARGGSRRPGHPPRGGRDDRRGGLATPFPAGQALVGAGLAVRGLEHALVFRGDGRPMG